MIQMVSPACSIIATSALHAPFTTIPCALHAPSTTNPTSPPPHKSPHFKNNWNSLQKAAAAILNAAEHALLSHERNRPFPKTTDPRIQLAGNFSPVPEHPLVQSLPIAGKIPKPIHGVYVRNGANPFFPPLARHHLFDGDGMIHAVRFQSDGSASYACRFTQTRRLIQECALNRPIFPKTIGELYGHYGIARLILFYLRVLFQLIEDGTETGVANAGLVFFRGKLLAMSEDDKPYHVQVTASGDIRTVGRYDFDGQLSTPMIAHPKVDPFTGDLHALGNNVLKKPFLRCFGFAKNGKKFGDVEIPITEPTMTHDFAITENHIIIPDQQVVFRLMEMIHGGSPVVYDHEKIARFGILKKGAENAGGIIWIEVPDCFCFHFLNGWEEGDGSTLVVIGSCVSPADSIFNEHAQPLKSVLSEIQLDLKTCTSSRRPIIEKEGTYSNLNLEMGMVNRNLLGRNTRFAYLAITDPWPKVSGFAKVNLKTGEVRKFLYGDGRYGGEPFFVPNNAGYVLTLVHDEKTWKSELLIVESVSLALEATVRLPSRVPYGFHGTFIGESELNNQI